MCIRDRARDIALNFNKTYQTEFFPLPEPMIDKKKEISKVIGTDGVRKMSKSLGNVIGIFDDEEIIRKQIMSCFTDPSRIRATDPGKVEGNTVFIFHDLLNDNLAEVQDLKDRYTKGEVGDVEVKEKLFNAHMRYFKDARERRKQFEKDMKSVEAILELSLIHISIFDFWKKRKKFDFKYYFKVFLTAFLIVGSYLVYLLIKGTFADFMDATFLTNFRYVELEEDANYWNAVKIAGSAMIFYYALIKLYKHQVSRIVFVVFLTLVVDITLVTLSGRPYIHYLIQLLPVSLLSLSLIHI